jgi:nucleoside triphosphate diphosphatase
VGDVLFACVNVARRLNVDPELELRRASQRFVSRVEEAERLAAADGARFSELALAEQDRYFDVAKELE